MRARRPSSFDRVDPRATPRARWRDEVLGASGLNIVMGVWLALSPLLLAYGSGDPWWNDVLMGALIATFALLRVTGSLREAWFSWINLLLGLWVFLNGLLFAVSTAASVNELITGTLVFMLAALSIAATDSARRGRGRRSR